MERTAQRQNAKREDQSLSWKLASWGAWRFHTGEIKQTGNSVESETDNYKCCEVTSFFMEPAKD